MASVTCTCGKASLTFAADRPRTAIECCCCDCTAGPKWCEANGGPKVGNPPQLLNYVDNDIVKVEGEEFLRTMMLRQGGASIRVICNECKTQLASVHFLYFRQRVMIVPGACQWKHEGEPLVPYMRMQTKFYDEEKYGPIPPFEHGPSYASDNPLWPFSCGLLAKLAHPPCPTRQGESIQEIIKRLPPPIIANVPEPDLEGHFKTHMGMFSMTFKNPFAASGKQEQHSNNNDKEDDNPKQEDEKETVVRVGNAGGETTKGDN